MLTRLQTLLLSLPPKCHLIKLLPVKVALCKPRSESPFQAASPRSHYNREACQHTGWHCPGTNVMALCSHTQKHWPCSTIYNNATYKRLLSLVYEVYTVLRSVLHQTGWPKLKWASLPTHLAQSTLTVLLFFSMAEDEEDICERSSVVHGGWKERDLW